MRVFGIIAIFLLALVAIVEGAALIRLSGQMDRLQARIESAPASAALRVKDGEDPASGRASPGAARPALTAPLPRLLPAPPTGDIGGEGGGPATATLREALETPEGRSHLKAAMEVLREQDRQERLIRQAEENISDEQRYRERLTRLAGLSPDEQNRVAQLHANLHTGRQRVLEELRAGGKSASQADDEIDNLEDQVERDIRALLGDARLQKFREASRAERRNQRGQQRGPAPPPVATP